MVVGDPRKMTNHQHVCLRFRSINAKENKDKGDENSGSKIPSKDAGIDAKNLASDLLNCRN